MIGYTGRKVLSKENGKRIINKAVRENKRNSSGKKPQKRRMTPSLTEKKKNMTYESGRCHGMLVGNRSRARITDQKYFSIEKNGEEGYDKVKNRQPTPVALKKEEDSPKKPNSLSRTANERVVLYNSDHKIPQFASENPSLKSQFSDKVESHSLTEIDDYDIDENLNSLVLSI